jgi:two-component system LytT family sensor kinase
MQIVPPGRGDGAAQLLKVWALSGIPWVAIGAVSVAQMYVARSTRGESVDLRIILSSQAVPYAAWWVMTPVVTWVTWSLPMSRKATSIAGHSVTALVLALVPTAVMVAMLDLMHLPWAWRGWWWEFRSMLAIRYGGDLVTYVGAVALLTAAMLARAAQHEAVRRARLEADLAHARLQALTGQLKPHFLFNALNSVAMLIRASASEAALRAVLGYAELLRTILKAEASDIPLREELAFARRYVEIEQMRFPEALEMTLDVEAEAETALVPSLILQPLVENALRHGLSPRLAGGELRISARILDGSILELQVRDNGVGMPARSGYGQSGGVGLRNTEARLANRFQGKSSVTLSVTPGGGTTVTILMPVHGVRNPVYRGSAA